MELWNEGYTPNPTTELQRQASVIDRGIAEYRCSCGGWMRYEAWFKKNSYRAFVVCDKCGREEEF